MKTFPTVSFLVSGLAVLAIGACDAKPADCAKCPQPAASKASTTPPPVNGTPDKASKAPAAGKSAIAEPTPAPTKAAGVALTAPGGVSLTTAGPGPAVGSTAPDFKVARFVPGNRIPETASWSDTWKGKPLIVSVVPSLDTKVCELQTSTIQSRYDEPKYKDAAVLVTLSKDLPFAMGRFAETHPGATLLYSDYKYGDVGTAWGLDVVETGLLARSVWVLDGAGKVVYREIVEDQASEPGYDALFGAVDTLLGTTGAAPAPAAAPAGGGK